MTGQQFDLQTQRKTLQQIRISSLVTMLMVITLGLIDPPFSLIGRLLGVLLVLSTAVVLFQVHRILHSLNSSRTNHSITIGKA
jgi:hypothetical protein